MEEQEQLYTIILRHDTSTNWMINDPVLALGEYGVEDDTHRLKRGDGTSNWSQLLYENFGLEYIVTFENLTGSIEDNPELSQAFNNTISKDFFEQDDNKILVGMTFTGEDGVIGKISKVQRDVKTNRTNETLIKIVSDDDTITGTWSVDKSGSSILNLKAISTIQEFEAGVSYQQGQIITYQDLLLKAKNDVESKQEIDMNDWIILASRTSTNIEYNPEGTALEATTVQEAITEVDNQVNEVKQQLNELDELIII